MPMRNVPPHSAGHPSIGRGMAWAGLSKAQMCEKMRDLKRNGNRATAQQVIAHMKDDPLAALWAWQPQ